MSLMSKKQNTCKVLKFKKRNCLEISFVGKFCNLIFWDKKSALQVYLSVSHLLLRRSTLVNHSLILIKCFDPYLHQCFSGGFFEVQMFRDDKSQLSPKMSFWVS